MGWADIETILLGEWAVFGRALYIIAGIAAAGGAIWMLVNWRYGGIIASLRTRLRRAEERYRGFDREFPGKTAAEVAARVHRLERHLASLPPRRLTDGQKQAIVNVGSPPPTASTVAIVHDSKSPEVGRYARDFVDAFKATPGWNVVSELYPMPVNITTVGVAVCLADLANPTGVELLVQQALRDAEIEHDTLPRTTPGVDVEIIVSGR